MSRVFGWAEVLGRQLSVKPNVKDASLWSRCLCLSQYVSLYVSQCDIISQCGEVPGVTDAEKTNLIDTAIDEIDKTQSSVGALQQTPDLLKQRWATVLTSGQYLVYDGLGNRVWSLIWYCNVETLYWYFDTLSLVIICNITVSLCQGLHALCGPLASRVL